MAQENKYGDERTRTGAASPTSNVLSNPSTSTTSSVDPATSTISTTPGAHTGREGDSDMSRRTDDMADRAYSKASHAADQAREKAGEFAGQAREKVVGQLDSRKETATNSLHSISDALRQTSSSLRNQNEGQAAGFVESAAEQMDRLTGYLQNRSVNELLDEAQRLARREPALFIGGAFVLGLLGARFFKSHNPERGYYEGGYGGGYSSAGYGGSRYDRSGYGTYPPRTPGAYRGANTYGPAGEYDSRRTGGYYEREMPSRSTVGQPRGWEVE